MAAIRFTGDPGVSAAEPPGSAEVVGRVILRFSPGGSRSDRLEAFFHGRGYREARDRRETLHGNRRRSGPAPVTLESRYMPGPRTVLTFEGYDLPAGVREKMDASGRARCSTTSCSPT